MPQGTCQQKPKMTKATMNEMSGSRTHIIFSINSSTVEQYCIRILIPKSITNVSESGYKNTYISILKLQTNGLLGLSRIKNL